MRPRQVPGVLQCYVAQLPAAASVLLGTVAYIRDVGPAGIYMISDQTMWRPLGGRQLLYKKVSTLASPLATVTGVTGGAFTLSGGNPTIPAGLVKTPGTIKIKAGVKRTSNTATATLSVRLGTSASSSDNQVWTSSLAATTNLESNVEAKAFITSDTTYTAQGVISINGTATASASDKSGATIDFATSAMVTTLDMTSANVGDTFNLWNLEVWYEA